MRRQGYIIFVLLPITLCSSAAPAAEMHVVAPAKPERYAWDGLGQDPNQPHVNARRAAKFSSANPNEANNTRAQVLATLRPYSKAWWIVHDEIESDLDNRLGRKLAICRGCLPASTATDDQVGSIPGN
jgi:hypothetical protein